jgi:hypothetical protein
MGGQPFGPAALLGDGRTWLPQSAGSRMMVTDGAASSLPQR